MGIHRLHVPELLLHSPGPGAQLCIGSDEARHAVSVKRTAPGDTVELLDGLGAVATARVTDARKRTPLVVEILSLARRDPVAPRVEIAAPIPKGDRLAQMIDQLSQAGAAAWIPLTTERAERTEKPLNLERLTRVATEAMKQSGRAHRLEIAEPLAVLDALESGVPTLLADASGSRPLPPITGRVRVLIGPEGGFTPAEIAAAAAADIAAITLGPHVMRIETAAVAAASITLAFR